MKKIHVLTNSIQPYAWGSRSAIAELLGAEGPSDTPQAEMWMGAHPKAPSMIEINNTPRSLIEIIENHPVDVLGQRAAARFENQLPYLMKVLAAESPLSIQAHPNAVQAASGYARENLLGIPLDAPHRNYRDDHHKPECICALSNFWALCGFRKVPAMLSMLTRLCPQTLQQELLDLKRQPDADGLKTFFYALMTMEKEKTENVIQEAFFQAKARTGEDDAFDWIVTLEDVYPGDVGVIFPALLNLVCLEPGEAMFLPSGELHAYLRGVAVELMANSDNVLRGGLTDKHVDVQELMNILSFQVRNVEILRPAVCRPHEKIYRTPAEEFVLSVIKLGRGQVFESLTQRSSEILLVILGSIDIHDSQTGEGILMKKGVSVIVPAAVKQYRLSGEGMAYKASVPM